MVRFSGAKSPKCRRQPHNRTVFIAHISTTCGIIDGDVNSARTPPKRALMSARPSAADSKRLLLLVGLSACVGVLSGGAAYLLVRLISLFTGLAFFGELTWGEIPDISQTEASWRLPVFAVGGALIIATMARWAPVIKGHGFADAMVAIEAAAKVDGTKGVIVSTRPSGSSRWLRVNLPARARKLLNVPVTHVVTLEAKDGA